MKKTKYFFMVFICVAAIAVISVIPLTVQAIAIDGCDVTWEYNPNTGVLIIGGTGDMKDFSASYNVPWAWLPDMPDGSHTVIKTVIIEEGVTSIGNYAFGMGNSIKAENVIIANSVTRIGNHAFEYCTMESITIPDSVTSIGSYAFSFCTNLKSISIPNSVSYIGSYAFKDCYSLEDVYINSLEAWCSIKFAATSANPMVYADNIYINDLLATDLVIPEGVTEIKPYAFCYCDSCTSAIIPDSVTSIGTSAFEGCTALVNVTILDSVTSIGTSAFEGCTALVNVTIPDSVTSIGTSAFEECTNLVSIEIPNGVTEIGSSAFECCSSLMSIQIPDGVTDIYNETFYGCSSLTNITIPNSVLRIEKLAFYDTAYYNDDSNWEDDVLYVGKYLIKAKTTIEGDYSIKRGTRGIADYAFDECWQLTSVVFPTDMTSIGILAFNECYLLSSVILPVNVLEIGLRAFDYCDSKINITDVYYSGDEDDWNAINMDSGNERLTDATIHYNYIYPMNETFLAIGTYENAAEAEVVVTDGGEVTVKVKITNKKKLSTSKVAVYVVSYGSGGVKDIAELSKKTASSSVTFTGNVSGSYKIFIWDKNMCPITEDIE